MNVITRTTPYYTAAPLDSVYQEAKFVGPCGLFRDTHNSPAVSCEPLVFASIALGRAKSAMPVRSIDLNHYSKHGERKVRVKATNSVFEKVQPSSALQLAFYDRLRRRALSRLYFRTYRQSASLNHERDMAAPTPEISRVNLLRTYDANVRWMRSLIGEETRKTPTTMLSRPALSAVGTGVDQAFRARCDFARCAKNRARATTQSFAAPTAQPCRQSGPGTIGLSYRGPSPTRLATPLTPLADWHAAVKTSPLHQTAVHQLFYLIVGMRS